MLSWLFSIFVGSFNGALLRVNSKLKEQKLEKTDLKFRLESLDRFDLALFQIKNSEHIFRGLEDGFSPGSRI